MDIIFDSAFSMSYPIGLCFENFVAPTDELIYFINGSGTSTINGITYKCKPNSLCYTHAGDKRNQICDKRTDYICIRFNLKNSDINIKTGIYQITNDIIYSLFLDVQNELSLKKYKYLEICNLKIKEILYRMVRQTAPKIKENSIYSLIQDIDSMHIFNKSVQEMADSVSYSYSRFRHKFKEITGVSPTEYLINKRIEYACFLLLNSNYSCTEISQICHFSNPGQFSTMFKKKTGMSPKAYRKKT